MLRQAYANSTVGKIMLVGTDVNQILERRFMAAGCQVVKVNDDQAAIDHARRESLDATVLISKGSLIDIAETFFNLRDLNRSMEIIVLVNRRGRHPSRFLRQLLEHPIEGTRIFTRRQLQKRLQAYLQQSPPGTSLLTGLVMDRESEAMKMRKPRLKFARCRQPLTRLTAVFIVLISFGSSDARTPRYPEISVVRGTTLCGLSLHERRRQLRRAAGDGAGGQNLQSQISF